MASSSSTDVPDATGATFSSFADAFVTTACDLLANKPKDMALDTYFSVQNVSSRILDAISDEVYGEETVQIKDVVNKAFYDYSRDLSIANPTNLKWVSKDLIDLSEGADIDKLRLDLRDYSRIVMLSMLDITTKVIGLDCTLDVCRSMGSDHNDGDLRKVMNTFFSSILANQVATDIFHVGQQTKPSMLQDEKVNDDTVESSKDGDMFRTPEKKFTYLPVQTEPSVHKASSATKDEIENVISHTSYEIASQYLLFMKTYKIPMDKFRKQLHGRLGKRVDVRRFDQYIAEHLNAYFQNHMAGGAIQSAVEVLNHDMKSPRNTMDDVSRKELFSKLKSLLRANRDIKNREHFKRVISAYITLSFIRFGSSPSSTDDKVTKYRHFDLGTVFKTNCSRSSSTTNRSEDFNDAIMNAFITNLTTDSLTFEVPDVSDAHADSISLDDDGDLNTVEQRTEHAIGQCGEEESIGKIAHLYVDFIKEPNEYNIGSIFEKMFEQLEHMPSLEVPHRVLVEVNKAFNMSEFSVLWRHMISFLSFKYSRDVMGCDFRAYDDASAFFGAYYADYPVTKTVADLKSAIRCYFILSFRGFGMMLRRTQNSAYMETILSALDHDNKLLKVFVSIISPVFQDYLTQIVTREPDGLPVVTDKTIDMDEYFTFSNPRGDWSRTASSRAMEIASSFLDHVSESKYSIQWLGKTLFTKYSLPIVEYRKVIKRALDSLFDNYGGIDSYFYVAIEFLFERIHKKIFVRYCGSYVQDLMENKSEEDYLQVISVVMEMIGEFFCAHFQDFGTSDDPPVFRKMELWKVFPEQDYVTDRQALRYKDFIQAIKGAFYYNLLFFDLEPKYSMPNNYNCNFEDDPVTGDEEEEEEEEEEEDEEEQEEEDEEEENDEEQEERDDGQEEGDAEQEKHVKHRAKVISIARKYMHYMDENYTNILNPLKAIGTIVFGSTSVMAFTEFLRKSKKYNDAFVQAIIYVTGFHSNIVRRNLSPHFIAKKQLQLSQEELKKITNLQYQGTPSYAKEQLVPWLRVLIMVSFTDFAMCKTRGGNVIYTNCDMETVFGAPGHDPTEIQKGAFEQFIACITWNISKRLANQATQHDDHFDFFDTSSDSPYDNSTPSSHSSKDNDIDVICIDSDGSSVSSSDERNSRKRKAPRREDENHDKRKQIKK